MSAPTAGTRKEAAATVQTELPVNLTVLELKNGRVSYRGDFRAFKGIGGKRQVLVGDVPADDEHARKRAIEAYTKRLDELQTVRANQTIVRLSFDPRIGPLAVHHLRLMAASPSYKRSYVRRVRQALERFIVASENARLSTFTVAWIEKYVSERRMQPGRRPNTLIAANTIRNEINALCSVFGRALDMKLFGENPVLALPDRPNGNIPEAVYLSAGEVARLLDAAAELDAETRAARAAVREYDERHVPGEHRPLPPFDIARRTPFLEAILATLVYTGGRLSEVLGLTVEELRFGPHPCVLFRDNRFRELKYAHHKREVEFWRPLRRILAAHIEEHGLTEGLLFPGRDGAMRTGIASSFQRCLERAGLTEREDGKRLTRHSLRHTYATHMLHTVMRDDRGRLVQRSVDSVRRRLGHRTAALIETVYGHLDLKIPLRQGLNFEPGRRYPARRLGDQGRFAAAIATTRSTPRRHLELVA